MYKIFHKILRNFLEFSEKFLTRKGQLSNNQWALVVYNVVDGPEKIVIDFDKLFGENSMQVRDLWAHNDLGIFNKTYTTTPLSKHQGMFLRLKPHKWN